eukprot:2281404-Prymnesium_polylepis.1
MEAFARSGDFERRSRLSSDCCTLSMTSGGVVRREIFTINYAVARRQVACWSLRVFLRVTHPAADPPCTHAAQRQRVDRRPTRARRDHRGGERRSQDRIGDRAS